MPQFSPMMWKELVLVIVVGLFVFMVLLYMENKFIFNNKLVMFLQVKKMKW